MHLKRASILLQSFRVFGQISTISNCVNFNQAALRAVLKLKNMLSSAQAKQFSRCLD